MFSEIPGNIYSRFPMNTEMLFLVASSWRGEIAAKACHWLLGVLASITVMRLAASLVPRRSAVWAGLCFFAIPSVFHVSTIAYVEMMGIFYLLLAWDLGQLGQGKQRGCCALAALFLGVACGSKYTLLLPAIAVSLFLIHGAGRRWFSRGVLITACALVGGGFWYLRNAIELGNPIYPFFYGLFGGPGWDAERAQVFSDFLRQWGDQSWWVPFTVTFRASFNGIENVARHRGIALSHPRSW